MYISHSLIYSPPSSVSDTGTFHIPRDSPPNSLFPGWAPVFTMALLESANASTSSAMRWDSTKLRVRYSFSDTCIARFMHCTRMSLLRICPE